MTVKVGETYRFEGVVKDVRDDGAAKVRFLGGDDRLPYNTWVSAAEMAAATLIEKPYEPAVGDVVTWGHGTVAARVVAVDGEYIWLRAHKCINEICALDQMKSLRRLPPETPLGPIAASQEGE